MKTRTRRIAGGILMAAGLVLAAVVITAPGFVAGGLGPLAAAVMVVAGWHHLTDLRPRSRPYDHETEGM